MRSPRGADEPFAGKLGRAVDRQRPSGILLPPWALKQTIKYVVGGKMDERHSPRGCPARDHPWRLRIDAARSIRLILGLVDSCIRGSVNDKVRVDAIQYRFNRGTHGQVKVRSGYRDHGPKGSKSGHEGAAN